MSDEAIEPLAATIDVPLVGTLTRRADGTWVCDFPGFSMEQRARVESSASVLADGNLSLDQVARAFGGTVRADTKGGGDEGRLHD